MNERRGAMCDNHKSFLFLFPWLDMQEYLNFSTGNNSGKSEEFNFQKLYYSKNNNNNKGYTNQESGK